MWWISWIFSIKNTCAKLKTYVPGQIWQNFTNRKNFDTHKTEISHENRDHTLEIFKLKLCKSGNVLFIHVADNIRSPVAAQPVFLGLA